MGSWEEIAEGNRYTYAEGFIDGFGVWRVGCRVLLAGGFEMFGGGILSASDRLMAPL